jgi:hypothetical protein
MHGGRNGPQSNNFGHETPELSHYLPTDIRQIDPALAAVCEAWDRLPEAIRAAILAMVKAASAK